MALYIVSFDVSSSEDKKTEYERTRQALTDAITKFKCCKVLETVYIVRSDEESENVGRTIANRTSVTIGTQPHQPYRLIVAPKDPKKHFAGEGFPDAVINEVKALLDLDGQ